MSSAECVFCKMVAGEVPVNKIYEDSEVLAFLDIGPISDGHTLVIPKRHEQNVHSCEPELMAELGKRLPKIAGAVQKAMDAEGYNVLCNNARAAGQVVEHLHFHIIPRNIGDGLFDRWPSYKYEQGKAEQIAEKIRKEIQ